MACTWKNCVLLAAFWDNIHISFGPNGAQLGAPRAVMVHSTRHNTLLLAPSDVVLFSESEKSSWIVWRIQVEISLSKRLVLLGRFLTRSSRSRVSHHAIYRARRSLTLYCPFAYTCSYFGARVRRRHILRKTARGSCRSLNILTAHEPMGLSSRRRMLLLASHCMALTRERKNPSRIAREIEIFSVFAWLVPTLVPNLRIRSITRRFEFSAAQSVDHDDWLSIMKHLAERK